jgi:hypothetical protein
MLTILFSILMIGLALPIFDMRSVIVCHLYVVGITVFPHEAHAKLVVHTNAMLAQPVIVEFFQPVARRNSQVFQAEGRMERGQLPLGNIS